MSVVEIVKLPFTTSSGNKRLATTALETRDGRIYFWAEGRVGTNTQYALSQQEIRPMHGAHYHGYDEDGPYPKKKVWSVDDCQRNRMQIGYLAGKEVFAWFDRPLIRNEYRPLTRGGIPQILMPHQADMSDAGLTYHYQIFGAEMGTGKGGLPSTKVATPTGWTTLGEIQVGDTVINPSGGTTRVCGIYRRGRMPMYRVTFSDGASTVCSGDHLWCVRTAGQKHRGRDYTVRTLQEISDAGLCYDNGNAKHYIPMVEPVQYASRALPIPPYLVGYILGNGGLSGWANIVSIPDQETVDRLNTLMGVPLCRKKDSEYDYRITDSFVNRWIEDAGLRGCRSAEKHVGNDYLFASLDDRLGLLQGLCDSDGYACETGGVEYTTTSPRLRDVFVALVQSFGGTCAIAEKLPEYTYRGERRVGQLAYRINASFPSDIMPFRLSRKVACYIVPSKYEPTRSIVRVESVGDDECICIAVESDEQRYVTDDYIVTHNTLSAQLVIEKSGVNLVWWAGPKTSIPNIKREFKLWGFPSHIQVEFFTYEGLVRIMDEWDGSQTLPRFFVADESSRCKNDTSQRSKAVQKLADLIRDTYGYEGYVIEMSGTPSPKTPMDWWSQCEIAWPGFLKEGSRRAMEERLAFMVTAEYDAGKFKKRIGWKDNENKCVQCGALREEGPHDLADLADPEEYHPFEPSKNEVAYLYERLKGLVVVKHKKDCLNLPEKRYRKIICKPTASVLRVAQSIATNPAHNAVTGMTLLRELSDGFQYREVQDGMTACTHCTDGTVAEWVDPENTDDRYQAIDLLDPDLQARLVKETVPCPLCEGKREVPKYVRITREVPCPKDAALKMLFDENEEVGRLVVFAGFTGSVDHIVKLCLKEKWDVVRCDQGNFQVFAAKSDSPDGVVVTDEEPLDYWADLEKHGKVIFVANPESGGMSLTLVEARMAVYWSNSWKPEYRVQSEDRIHRKGMDENLGCTIVDLIHLPSDNRVLSVIRANRKLELMTLGEILDGVDWKDAGEEGEMQVEEMTP